MRRSIWATLLAMLLSLLLTQVARAASVAQTWSVGNEPFGVTIDPRDGRVYVAISDHNRWNVPTNMWAIDPTAPPWQPGPFPSPNDPFFELPGPQVMSVLDTSLDRLFVSMSTGLAIVQLPSRSITMLPTGAGLGMALDATTHRVYMATLSGLVAIDGATGSLVAYRAAPSGDAWWTVAQDPSRHLLFVTNGNYGGAPSLVVLNDGDLSPVANVPLPAIPRLALTVDASRGLVYVGGFTTGTGPTGAVYAIDEASFAIVKTLDVGGATATPFSTTLDPATNTLYVSNIVQPSYPGNELVMVDTTTFSVRSRLALSFMPGQSALHPDGRLYVSGSTYDGRGNYPGLLAKISLNTAPSVTVALDSAAPRTNDVLTATAAGSDQDGDALTYTFTWSVNGVTRRTLTTAATSDSFDLSLAGNGNKGDVVSVSVTAYDGTDTSASASASATVANSAPAVSVALSDANPRKRDVLVATATGADADSADVLTYTYTWRVNGKTKQTATTTATTNSLDLRAVEAENGDSVTVDVVVTDGTATANAAATATVTPPGH